VDVWIVEAGEATLIVGGTMVQPKTVSPTKFAALRLRAEKQRKPGDIVHIPVKVPHQLKIAPGKTFTYLAIEVNSN
jgi:mannose-6-phosphate isomerase-like protein (cupin superfamily)